MIRKYLLIRKYLYNNVSTQIIKYYSLILYYKISVIKHLAHNIGTIIQNDKIKI